MAIVKSCPILVGSHNLHVKGSCLEALLDSSLNFEMINFILDKVVGQMNGGVTKAASGGTSLHPRNF